MSIIMHISMLCSWTNISSVIFYDDAFFKMMKYFAIILYKMLLPILMCSIIVFLLFNCFTRWHVNYFSIGKKKYSSFKLVRSTFELNTKEIFFPYILVSNANTLDFSCYGFYFFTNRNLSTSVPHGFMQNLF